MPAIMRTPLSPAEAADARWAIRARGVTKVARRKLTMGSADSESVAEVWRMLRGGAGGAGVRKVASRTQADAVVLDDLSLDVAEGSVVALAGPSGSGKSLLLRTLAGGVPIDAGRIEISGEVRSLLNIGGGLDPNLSLAEIVAGERRIGERARRESPEARYRDIVAFSGLAKFTDVPTRAYSTGMRIRLAVALVLTSGADILLVDDVLEVGDLAFQRRVADRMEELAEGRATIVFASRDASLVERIADRVVEMRGGAIASDGPPAGADRPAPAPAPSQVGLSWTLADGLPDSPQMRVASFAPTLRGGRTGDHLEIAFDVAVKRDQALRPVIDLFAGETPLARSLHPASVAARAGDVHRFAVGVPLWMLGCESARLELNVISVAGEEVHSFKTRNLLILHRPDGLHPADGHFEPPLGWSVGPFAEAG